MSLLIKDATIINERRSYTGSVLIVNERIVEIYISDAKLPDVDEIVDASGKWLIPGAIDGHVHFREPGALHKGSMATESAAAVAGGVTSYMDMPNNDPPCCSIPLLEDKYQRAAACSYANYAFYLGANDDNIEEIKKIDPTRVPGVKLFMGASTGNMLVDNEEALARIFMESPVLIATHCEDEETIQKNLSKAKGMFGNHVTPEWHPLIRSRKACIMSTQKAIELAMNYNSRLHILHLTTKEEVALLATIKKTTHRITGEICVPHLYFSDMDYYKYGNLIKCNPAIKSIEDRDALRGALLQGVVQVVGSDHAPHTLEEKYRPYLYAPSGIPLIQYALPVMFTMAKEGLFTPEEVVDWMCHGPAFNYGVAERGFIKPGYYADLVLLDPERCLDSDTLLYMCGWSPLLCKDLSVGVSHTFVNGRLAYSADKGICNQRYGQPLQFKCSYE